MSRKPTIGKPGNSRKPLEDEERSLDMTSHLAAAYAELATDTDREAEADEWCEAFAGDGLDA